MKIIFDKGEKIKIDNREYASSSSFVLEGVATFEESDGISDVDLRAKLEQLTEECCELGKACMKLVRAKGNGNPCSVGLEEARDKVVEEWADVIVAGHYLMEMLQSECPYDIQEKIEEIRKEKVERWKKRVRDAK